MNVTVKKLIIRKHYKIRFECKGLKWLIEHDYLFDRFSRIIHYYESLAQIHVNNTLWALFEDDKH